MAGTLPLSYPPADLRDQTLSIVTVSPTVLCRVSRYKTGEPFFGRSGLSRFDGTATEPGLRFGTCYLGFDLAVAFAESVLHNEEPDSGRFLIPTSEIDNRLVLSFKGRRKLRLANMTGRHLLRLGGNGELSGTSDYRLPQAWAAAVLAHPSQVDGMMYMSRRVNDSAAVVLFERMPGHPPAIRLDQALPLFHHTDFVQTIKDFGVTLT